MSIHLIVWFCIICLLSQLTIPLVSAQTAEFSNSPQIQERYYQYLLTDHGLYMRFSFPKEESNQAYVIVISEKEKYAAIPPERDPFNWYSQSQIEPFTSVASPSIPTYQPPSFNLHSLESMYDLLAENNIYPTDADKKDMQWLVEQQVAEIVPIILPKVDGDQITHITLFRNCDRTRCIVPKPIKLTGEHGLSVKPAIIEAKLISTTPKTFSFGYFDTATFTPLTEFKNLENSTQPPYFVHSLIPNLSTSTFTSFIHFSPEYSYVEGYEPDPTPLPTDMITQEISNQSYQALTKTTMNPYPEDAWQQDEDFQTTVSVPTTPTKKQLLLKLITLVSSVSLAGGIVFGFLQIKSAKKS